MDTYEEFKRIAKFTEPEVRKWMDREKLRHGPNFPGRVWNWCCTHHIAYFAIFIGAALYGLLTSSQPHMGRTIHGIVWGVIALLPGAGAFIFARGPWWYEPKVMPRRFRDSRALRDLLAKDPALEIQEQVLKIKGDLDSHDLAHVLWLVRKEPFGKNEMRGLSLTSSLDSMPITTPADPAFSTE